MDSGSVGRPWMFQSPMVPISTRNGMMSRFWVTGIFRNCLERNKYDNIVAKPRFMCEKLQLVAPNTNAAATHGVQSYGSTKPSSFWVT